MTDGSLGSGQSLLDRSVLVLNKDFLPLNVCRTRRALILLLRGKAEIVEEGGGEVHATNTTFQAPSVIRLDSFVTRSKAPRRLTRREVFFRDRHQCQYCGKTSHQLTLDHVMPRHRGGDNSWSNMVSACVPCNFRKAGRTPEEAGMRLLHTPAPPSPNPYYPFFRYLDRRPEWRLFFPASILEALEPV